MKTIRNAASHVLRRWRRQQVITLTHLCQALQASVRTVRRRLKQWQALASFNHNSRFYTLPEVPQFDAHGLWFYRDIGFSRHGHLPQTIVALVRQSPAGLTAAQLGQCLHLDPRSFLWQFHEHPDLRREKYQGHFVYFAADTAVGTAQRAARNAALPQAQLPSAAEAIAILVLAIQQPQCSPQELCARLRPTHPQLTPAAIGALFAHHGLTLKKTPPPPGSIA
jgi:hypothetical protein